jgi:purine nucleosidase
MPRTFLIDTDTASDDAVALIMALRAPDVRVAAITVVSGNVPVDQGLRNALYTVALCGADTPVYRGAARPLCREPFYAFFFHGRDGLGDRGYPPPRRGPAPGEAVEAIVEIVEANPGIVLVTLGPLTNVAAAVTLAPGIADRVSRCIVMGGAACTIGNVTPAAEYNLWVDPEAARIVFRSGLPIEMVGWELCRGEANLLPHEMDGVRALGTALARFTLDCNAKALEANRELCGDPGIALPDPVAMAIALDPGVCTRSSRHHVEIETESELTRGMSVVDALDVGRYEHNREIWGAHAGRAPHVTVCWAIDVPRWKALLYAALRDG